jgi:hypothetical protein
MISGLTMADDSSKVINIFGDTCEHGLFAQPKGHFMVFVFCDSALGSNIGIILSRMNDKTGASSAWGIDHRFWQDGPWVTDVTSLAWDPFSERLYVATSEVYGDGGVFVLDLANRRFDRIYSITDVDGQAIKELSEKFPLEGQYSLIEDLNVEERTMTLSLRFFYGDGESAELGRKVVHLGTGTVDPGVTQAGPALP